MRCGEDRLCPISPLPPGPEHLAWAVTRMKNKFLLVKPLKHGSIFDTGIIVGILLYLKQCDVNTIN